MCPSCHDVMYIQYVCYICYSSYALSCGRALWCFMDGGGFFLLSFFLFSLVVPVLLVWLFKVVIGDVWIDQTEWTGGFCVPVSDECLRVGPLSPTGCWVTFGLCISSRSHTWLGLTKAGSVELLCSSVSHPSVCFQSEFLSQSAVFPHIDTLHCWMAQNGTV